MLASSVWDACPARRDTSLLVDEAIIGDERCHNSVGLIMSLHMLVETDAGFDSTASDVGGWVDDAGSRHAGVQPRVGPTSSRGRERVT